MHIEILPLALLLINTTGCFGLFGGGGSECGPGTHDEDGVCVPDEPEDSAPPEDADGDGYSVADGDCDDGDASVHPGAPDSWYDGVDSDCDGASDYDADADGYDSDAHGGDDCDDENAAINPGATETFYDGIDSDCNGLSDNDADEDGHDSADHGGDDCDDSDATVSPSADEVWDDGVDQDCDGLADVQDSSCSASLELTLPNGDSTTLDGCLDWSIDAAYEFDPDDPPEVRRMELTLGATTDVGFDCRVEIVQEGLCGEGLYDMRGSEGDTTLVLMDCSGVPDTWEDSYDAGYGYLRFDTIDTGSETGNLQGEPVYTGIEAHLHAWTAGGIEVEGDLVLGLTKLAIDEEEQTACAITDGDEDDDGEIGSNFDGTDCDDSSATTYSGAAELDSRTECMSDADDDGWGDDSPMAGVTAGTDCDDDNADMNNDDFDGDGATSCGGDCLDSDPNFIGCSSMTGTWSMPSYGYYWTVESVGEDTTACPGCLFSFDIEATTVGGGGTMTGWVFSYSGDTRSGTVYIYDYDHLGYLEYWGGFPATMVATPTRATVEFSGTGYYPQVENTGTLVVE
jgi:hypothetical protein